MTPEEKVFRGQRAQDLLNNEVLTQALDAIEAEVVGMWEQCPQRDASGKEALWQLYKTSKKFRALLLGYVQTGEFERENLKRYEEQSRLRRMFKVA